MSEHETEHEDVTDEEIADEIDKARKDGAGADDSQPWAKTSSGDADSITES